MSVTLIRRFAAWSALTVLAAASYAQSSFTTLVFEDNFNGTQYGTFDSTKWQYRSLGARNDAVNVEDAVYLDGTGGLVIKTYTATDGSHHTGMIQTKNLWTYGKFEARIKFEGHLGGMWSAFWLQSPTVGNPVGNPAAAGVELDVVEYRKYNSSNTNIGSKGTTNLHWDGYGVDHKTAGTGSGVWPSYTGNLADGQYHTFTVIWDSTSYYFYCDGQLVYNATTPISQRSEYIILSTEVKNGSWAGSIPASGYGTIGATTAKMRVDYVRVWQ